MDSIPKEKLEKYHYHRSSPEQCGSVHIQRISSPLATVWSLVRRFDAPRIYKPFVTSSTILAGDGRLPGSIREVRITTGLPAGISIERLDVLDEMEHVVKFTMVGGDHRLMNYQSTLTVHEATGGGDTVVVESYVTDVPSGNTVKETRFFADTIVRCNLKSLAEVAEKMRS